MAQCTAVIDIGSNSMRLAVFQKTSRFAFHIVHEVKSSVRLAENAYTQNGTLQEEAMDRASKAIGEFLLVAASFKARKILCVATSALRDAPNKSLFIQRIKKEYSLSINVINGDKEAYFGGVACANLLPKMDAISVDLGGGSTEFVLLSQGNLLKTLSLNIGTVRLKELFMDKDDITGAIDYIDDALKALPFDSTTTLIGIGGSFRALCDGMMKQEEYPLKKLHAYTCGSKEFQLFCNAILDASPKKLKNLGIKPDRFDTIKSGALVFLRILNRLIPDSLICSGAGVREGVFLSDMLRNCGHKFPTNYNPSLRFLLDTHVIHSNHGLQCAAMAKKLFDLTHEHLNLDHSFKTPLVMAAKLLPSGLGIRYFAYPKHSFYLAMSGLDYGLTHNEIVLTAHLLLYKKGEESSDLIPKDSYEKLLPEKKKLNALHSLLWLSHTLLSSRARLDMFSFSFDDEVLTISSPYLYLAQEQLQAFVLPKNLSLQLIHL